MTTSKETAANSYLAINNNFRQCKMAKCCESIRSDEMKILKGSLHILLQNFDSNIGSKL